MFNVVGAEETASFPIFSRKCTNRNHRVSADSQVLIVPFARSAEQFATSGLLVGGHVADRLPRWRCLLLFALAELAIAAFALVSKTFYYDFLYGEHVALSASVPILAIVLFLSLLWPTFFMGVSLPLLARGLTEEVQAASPTIGSLYGYNTLGAATGAVCTTWILLRYVGFDGSSDL